jgi:predicted dehydrogenase
VTEPRPLGIGVLGLGFMGRQHIASYAAAHAMGHPNRLVAVCDTDAARRAGRAPVAGNIVTGDDERLFDPADVRGYERPLELLADPAVELVSVCTYTDTHVDMTLAALGAGKHVLLEKPVALHVAEAERLVEGAAGHPGRICMPAMCMRFWPGWDWLERAVRGNTYGPVRRAAFRRVSPVPDWGHAFYGDTSRCGGALFDLHVHDADFVRFLFGAPRVVVSTPVAGGLVTRYFLDRTGAEVTAEGAWSSEPGAAFFMGFEVEFEGARAEYRFDRDPPLLLERDGESEPVPVSAWTGYDVEVRHVLDHVAGSGSAPEPAAMLADAVGLTAMLRAEAESLEQARPVEL